MPPDTLSGTRHDKQPTDAFAVPGRALSRDRRKHLVGVLILFSTKSSVWSCAQSLCAGHTDPAFGSDRTRIAEGCVVSTGVFTGRLASSALVGQVVAPAYDALTSEQRRQYRVDHPLSYLHVTRSAPDEDDAATVTNASLVARGRSALHRIQLEGAFDDLAINAFVVYELETADHRQRGIVCEVPAESFRDHALPHEATRPDRAALLAEHFVGVGAASSPVACAVRDDPALDRAIEASTNAAPVLECDTGDGLIQRLWKVSDPAHEQAITEALASKRLYIIDGHHRAAANKSLFEDGLALPVLTAIFTTSAMQLVGFHRLLRLPVGLTQSEFIRRIGQRFPVRASVHVPEQREDEVVVRALGLWHVVSLDERPAHGSVKVREGSLPPSVVEREIVAGIAGRDVDVDVVYLPDTQSPEAVASLAAADHRVAIFVPPVTMDDVIEVAEGGATMPAKTTFFTPKARSGLFLRSYEAELSSG